MLNVHAVAEMPPGSLLYAFFFSVETLATVGYGHMYPDSLYGHVVSTLEIMVGMFGLRNIITAEGEEVRRFRSLKLEFDYLITFSTVLTVRHRIMKRVRFLE